MLNSSSPITILPGAKALTDTSEKGINASSNAAANDPNSFQASLSREIADQAAAKDAATESTTQTASSATTRGAIKKGKEEHEANADQDADFSTDPANTGLNAIADGSPDGSPDASLMLASQGILALVNHLQQNRASANTAGSDFNPDSPALNKLIPAGLSGKGTGPVLGTNAVATGRFASPVAGQADPASPAASAASSTDVPSSARAGHIETGDTNPALSLHESENQLTPPSFTSTLARQVAGIAAGSQAAIRADAVNNAGTDAAALALGPDKTAALMQTALNAATVQHTSNPSLSAISTEHLAPRVGSSNWDQALGKQVVWMASNGQQTATLTLSPPDLGPLQVVLQVNNDQAHASFTAAQPEVRQALEAAMPRLREMMSDAGIQLGQASVGADSNSAQFFNQQSGQRARSSSGSPSGPTSLNQAGSATINAMPATLLRTGRGLVDTFA